MTAATTSKPARSKKVSKHPLRNLNILAIITFILAAVFYGLISYTVDSFDAMATISATLFATAGLYLLLVIMVTSVFAVRDRQTRRATVATDHGQP